MKKGLDQKIAQDCSKTRVRLTAGNAAGTATVEAALILPIVVLAILAVLSIIRIAGTHERIQHALNQVAEDMAQYSYLYALSGLKDKHDALADDISQAQVQLQEQQDAVTTFYQSIQSVVGDVGSLGNGSTVDVLLDTLADFNGVNTSFDALSGQIEAVLADPMGEVRLISLALSGALVNEGKTALLGMIAKSMLKGRLAKDLNIPAHELEARLRLGQQGLDFSCSSFFEDKQTIDLILEYHVKPMPDFFFIPEIKLRNRACVLAWTWGVDHQGQEAKAEGESLWDYTQTESYMKQNTNRGSIIEDRYEKELVKSLGAHAEDTPYWFKAIDVIEYAHGREPGKLITFFSLNPFLSSYQSEGAVEGAISKKLEELHEFNAYQLKDYMIDVTGKNYERVLYLIIPENEELPKFFQPGFEKAQKNAKTLGVKLVLVKKYGQYTKPYTGNIP